MTTVRRVKLADLDRALARDLRKLRERVVIAVHDTAGEGVLVVQNNAPVAFAELEDGIVGQSMGSRGARIRSTAPHSAAVEEGSRPHMPPFEPILAWVKLRGMQGLQEGATSLQRRISRRIHRVASVYEGAEIKRGPNKGAIRFSKRRALPIDAPEQVAWQVCHGIKKHGTKPTWFVRKSLPTIWLVLDRNVRRWLKRPL